MKKCIRLFEFVFIILLAALPEAFGQTENINPSDMNKILEEIQNIEGLTYQIGSKGKAVR